MSGPGGQESDGADQVTERRTPEEAFDAVADETRLSILRTLVEASDPLPFSELRAEVGVADSGRFNYHLDKLRDAFVRQTDGGDYEVTQAGQTIVGAIQAGRLTVGGTVGPTDVDGECSICGGALTATYDGALFSVDCVDCTHTSIRYPVPPTVIEDNPESYPLAAWRYVLSRSAVMGSGFCHICAGDITTRLERDLPAMPETIPVGLVRECERCNLGMQTVPLVALLHEPRVQALFAAADLDPRDEPPWQSEWMYESTDTTIVDEDPLTVRVAITIGEAHLQLTLDTDGSIIEEDG
ncbi:MAG: winged helix-turn-helix domain-containing protein [Halobacteriaceae archaeon]